MKIDLTALLHRSSLVFWRTSNAPNRSRSGNCTDRVDLQKGIASYPLVHPLAGIVQRTRELIDAFRENNLPVVLVNVAGRAPGRTEQGSRSSQTFTEGWTELLLELGRQSSDIVVTKRSWGAFATTDLKAQLKAKDVTQIIVTGVATSGGVEATARQAYEQGFNVTLALDAMTDVGEEEHAYSIAHVLPRLARPALPRRSLFVYKTERESMNWLFLVSYFFSGAFAANAIPHFVSGTMGRAFQSPFAKPPGEGLSSSTVNVLWGFFNAGIAYPLVMHVGKFHLRSWLHAFAFGLGALLIGTFSARHFGQFNGGNTSTQI